MGSGWRTSRWGGSQNCRCVMRVSLSASIYAAIAMLAGFVVLAGYFVEVGFLSDLRLLLVNWSVLLAAVAVIVGVIHIWRVHWVRIKTHQAGWFNSLVLIIFLIGTFIAVAFFGPVSTPSLFIFNYILAPIEMSLMALLAIILLMASVKLLKKRLSGYSLLFLGVVVLIIFGSTSLPGLETQPFGALKNWIAQTWAGAGVRGMLLGVVLGTVATGFRILMGVERPYSD